MEKLFSFFIFFAIFSCTPRQKQQVEQIDPLRNGGRYVVDLDGKKEESIPYSYIFKNMQTIILETSEDCLIGGIDELQVFDGFIYVLDKFSAKTLFVFDMEGHFIRKIGSVGNGPGEYIRLKDFTLDTENGFISLLDYGQQIHKYRLDGTFIGTVTPKLQDSRIDFIQFYKDRLYLSVSTWEPTPEKLLLLETEPSDGKILSSSIPIEHNMGWAKSFFTGHSFFISRMNAPPLYIHLFMGYIATVEKEITPYI